MQVDQTISRLFTSARTARNAARDYADAALTGTAEPLVAITTCELAVRLTLNAIEAATDRINVAEDVWTRTRAASGVEEALARVTGMLGLMAQLGELSPHADVWQRERRKSIAEELKAVAGLADVVSLHAATVLGSTSRQLAGLAANIEKQAEAARRAL